MATESRLTIEKTTDGVRIRVPGPRNRWAPLALVLVTDVPFLFVAIMIVYRILGREVVTATPWMPLSDVRGVGMLAQHLVAAPTAPTLTRGDGSRAG